MSRVTSAARAEEWKRVAGLDLLNAADAAIYLTVSLTTFEEIVRSDMGRRLIAVIRPAGPRGDRRFLRSDLDAYIAAIRAAAMPDPKLES